MEGQHRAEKDSAGANKKRFLRSRTPNEMHITRLKEMGETSPANHMMGPVVLFERHAAGVPANPRQRVCRLFISTLAP